MASDPRSGSLDCADDCFYSFPPSRVASCEDGATPKGSSEEYDRTPQSTYSLSTALNKDDLMNGTDQQHERGPDTPRSSRVTWTLPFAHHQETSTQYHFCSKPVLDRLSRHRLPSGFDHPSDGSHIPDFASLPDEPLTIEQLVSSPAAPVTTKQWSSTTVGASLRSAKSRNNGVPCLDPSIRQSRGVEDIVANIRTYLSTMRHDTCDTSRRQQSDSMSFATQDPNSRPDSTSENFLVSANDIAGILDIVIVGLRRLHREHLPSGCLSVLLPYDHNKRPIVTKADSILPTVSCLADPATTISSVKPMVIAAYSSHLQSLARKPIKSTIITKKSVAEVSWETTPDCSFGSSTTDSEFSSRRVSILPGISTCSSCGSQTALVSGVESQGPRTGQLSEPLSNWDFPKPLNRLYQDRMCGCEGTASAPNERNATPFQQVQSRGVVKNWMRASDEVNQQAVESADRGALYHNGIDAHAGAHSPAHTCEVVSDPCRNAQKREACGTSICNPHHRRCSDSDAIDPLLHKLRRYSFMPLEDQTPECLRRTEQKPESLNRLEELQLRDPSSTSSKTVLEDILDRFIFADRPLSRKNAANGGCTASR